MSTAYTFLQVALHSVHSFSCTVCGQDTHVTGQSINDLLATKMITAQDIDEQFAVWENSPQAIRAEGFSNSESLNGDIFFSEHTNGSVRCMNGLASTMHI